MVGELVPRPPAGEIDKSYREYQSDRALGKADLYSQVLNAAADKICGLYGKSPATLVKIIPFGTGLIDNSRGIFDDLCQDTPKPPLPAPQFTGGQCDGVVYFLDIAYTRQLGRNTPDCNLVYSSPLAQRAIVYGPVSDVHLEVGAVIPGTCQIFGWREIWATCRGTSATGLQPLGSFQITGSGANDILGIDNIALRINGGVPDSCGDPAPSYPPPSANPNDLTSTTNITIAPNTTVSVPVSIVPTFAPVTGIFRPEFNVNVGGINVNFSLGGVTFSPTVEIAPNINVPYSDPRSITPSPLPIRSPSGSPSSGVDLKPVTDRLDEVLAHQDDCCDPAPAKPDDPLYINKTVSALEAESATIALPAGTYKVRVLLTQQSPKGRKQFGGTEADVIYAGWGWFSSSFSLGERLPIDADNKQFVPPNAEQESFTFTCYVGFKAVCTVYYKEKKPGV